jgi:hypothetical protein
MSVIWQEEFPSSFRVPKEIVRLASSGVIEDMSWRQDPAPSFGARLKDKNFVRLWVEHPDIERRMGWGRRYTLVVQPEPSIPFGWIIVSTDDVYEALSWLTELLRNRGRHCRFKVSQGGVA